MDYARAFLQGTADITALVHDSHDIRNVPNLQNMRDSSRPAQHVLHVLASLLGTYRNLPTTSS